MSSRSFFILCASLLTLLPEAAWAGSGGPNGMVTYGAFGVIIIMLAAILKKLY
jgi:hypothetical protein